MLLLDVNVLVALFHPDHVHHDAAHDWFSEHRDRGWATSPVTENEFLRVALALAPPEDRLRPPTLVAHLRQFCDAREHVFWPDAISLGDRALFDLSFVARPAQLTDVYLLGLAMQMRGRLATFDRKIPLKAVRGATTSHLAIVGPVEAESD